MPPNRHHQPSDDPPSHAPYALVGTPLLAYDSQTRDDGSYVPVWQQTVTDSQGRKRLHGAFTGGWSAGYFNSVGSKEGWTPATFVSSRDAKRRKIEEAGGQGKDGGAGKGQRVEDFMDEEDLADREEGRAVEVGEDFAGLGGRKTGDGSGMFGDIFRSEGEGVGVRLLKRMGWRVGQGIGPKVRRRARGDKSGEGHLFAPDDVKVVGFRRKRDRKGLGFEGEEKLGGGDDGGENGGGGEDDESERDARILRTEKTRGLTKPKQKMKKSGLGVGVLNDTGSDDEDAYDMGPKISYNRITGGDKRKKKGGLLSTNANPAVQKATYNPSKNLTQRQTALSGFRKCHDGRLPLDGFILATAALTIDENKYPPPEVPADWKPSRLSQNTPTTTAADSTTTPLDPKSRAALLGEAPLPGKSVFDFLTPAARATLAAATNRTDLPAAGSEKAPADFQARANEAREAQFLDAATAKAALNRAWLPYEEEENKRGRYRTYLSFCATRSNTPGDATLPPGISSEEAREFQATASVFARPIAGGMAERFASATLPTPSTTTTTRDEPGALVKVTPVPKEEDPAMKAAKLGMFGPLTRSRVPFYPSRLLCKRFNFPAPAIVSGDDDARERKGPPDLASQASLDRMMAGSRFVAGGVEVANLNEGMSGRPGDGEDGGKGRRMGGVDVERNEALEGKRAGEAVFKAIFGDDSDEDD